MRVLFLVCLLLTGTQAAFAYTAKECVECHRGGSAGSGLHISVEGYLGSVHGREGMACTDCHNAVRKTGHHADSAPVSCTQCHDRENRHGIGSASRPQCFSCHTKHAILEKGNSASSVHPESLKKTCSTCHPVECGKSDYLSWLPSLQVASHGKQDFSRAYERSNCIGCHQGLAAHGEKEPIDGQNCYRCHQSMTGYVHPRADREKEPGVFAAAVIYQMSLGALLLGGCGFIIFRGRR